jgi:hypothetical protein
VQVTPPAPVGYPDPGSGYPVSISAQNYQTTLAAPAYYEASSITTPVRGLWRRTFTGTALTALTFDTNFPASYTQVESMQDEPVGFAQQLDVSTQYSMEWTGYFKPAFNGNFNFYFLVDDYLAFWIGANAVSGNTWANAEVKGANALAAGKYPLVAGRYYPIRIAYTENFGGNGCAIWAAQNGFQPQHNVVNEQGDSNPNGQFYFNNSSPIDFPSSGLIN